MTPTSSVQSLDRAFDLLELLCRSSNGLTITELSAETGLHKSTVHRLLAAMCARGYVQHDMSSSAYHAGMRLCEMSGYVIENLDITERARKPLENLRRISGETVHLVVREESEIVYIQKVESKHSVIRMFTRIGMRRPLYCTGVGKAILSTLSDEEIDMIWKSSEIEKYTAHTIVQKKDFMREITMARKQGFAQDNEEIELGVRCIAAAITDYSGRASYAISISAPLSRMSDERVETLRKPLAAAKKEISAMLGG